MKKLAYSEGCLFTLLIVSFAVQKLLSLIRSYLLTFDSISISLTMSHVEHLFMCLLAICMSSLDKYLFRSLSYFLIGLSVFLALSYMGYLYISEINPLSVVSFAIIFSHSKDCLFTLLPVSFIVQKF